MRLRSVFALTLTLLPAFAVPLAAAEAVLLGSFTWREEVADFGGFSAIEVTDDGEGFLTVNDRGFWMKGRFLRDTSGQITGIEPGTIEPLLARNGFPLREGRTDAEGMALAADGTLYVSFEGPAQVLSYAYPGASSLPLPVHREFSGMDANAALESLAITEDGTLWAIREDTRDGVSDFPIYLYRNPRWEQPFFLPRLGDYLPVSADFGPDGRLYVLERRFSRIFGFASRLRRFSPGAGALGPGEILLETPVGQRQNLEGLSVWRDDQGLRATMISDDNFSVILHTEIVEYRITD